MSTVLFVVTSARTLTLSDGTAHPTGYWAEELFVPYRVLTEAGHRVVRPGECDRPASDRPRRPGDSAA